MNKKIALKKILHNAKSSIKLGAYDYELSKKEKIRKISSIRNLLAGILLIYKYKLILISEGEDHYEHIRTNGNNNGLPVKTINSKETINKLKKFNIFINEKTFYKIVQYRNNIEHLFNVSNIEISRVVNDAFYLISNFINTHLKNVGYIEYFLGRDVYNILLENKNISTERKEKCNKTFYKYEIQFPSSDLFEHFLDIIDCPKCTSNFIKLKKCDYPNLDFICDHCSEVFSFDDFFHTTHYERINGSNTISECYECGDWNFIYGACWSCGFIADPDIDYERKIYLEYLMQKND